MFSVHFSFSNPVWCGWTYMTAKLNITLRQHSPKAPTFGGLIRYELSRQLNGKDWFLLFYRSISCQFQ
jgi:hypothetical protein